MMYRFFSVVACFASVTLAAQNKDLTDVYAQKYPGESSAFVARTEANTIRIENNKPIVYTDNHEDLIVLSEKTSNYSDRPIYFTSFTEITRSSGYTLVPDGKGKYKTVSASKQGITNEFSEGSFYDDVKAIHVNYSSIQKGSRIVSNYTEKLNEARFFGRFFFSSTIPCEYSEFSIVVPKGVKITSKLFGITEKELIVSQEKNGSNIKYTWRAEGLKKYERDEDGPSSSYYAPHIVVYINEYTESSGKVVKLLDGPNGLYDWYYSMVNGVGKKENPVLQKLVDSLTAGETDEFAKVTTIFYWVQDNIKYVAFEDGMGGFVPREAANVCDRRYGDCKDMANIITTMLSLAHIPAHLTWIGTRHIPYTYEDVPSPLADNHMISTYVKDSTYWFLDATGKHAPIGMHTSMIQGKEALISYGDGQYKIIRVPVIPKEQNTRVDSVFMQLHIPSATPTAIGLYGKGFSTIKGYEKIHLTYPLDAMSEKEKSDFFIGYFRKGNNSFGVDSLHYNNLYDRNLPLKVDFSFAVSDYVRRNNNEIYVNFNIDKSYQNDLLDPAERKTPREIDYLSTERHVTVLEIPQGWSVGYLPPDATYDGKDFGFRITYKQVGNRIVCEKNIWINTLLIQPDQFETWNRFVKLLTKAYTESISLKKKA